MVKLDVFDPSGLIDTEKSSQYAPRLTDLKGRTIGEVSDGAWEDYRTFPLIRQMLKERFPDIKIVPYTEFPTGVRGIDVEEIGDMIAAKGCDAVIGGNSA